METALGLMGSAPTARQKVLEFPLHKPREALPFTPIRSLRSERLVVLAHDLMQRALLGATGATAERGLHGDAGGRNLRTL